MAKQAARAPEFGQTVAYWSKSKENTRVPATVCGFFEDKAGRYWAELRPHIPPGLGPIWRECDDDYAEVPYGCPGQQGTWTFLDETIPTPAQ